MLGLEDSSESESESRSESRFEDFIGVVPSRGLEV